MSIKAGAILHDVNGYVIDRIQTAGPGNLNIPEEKVYELGNWNAVATIRDIPDLTFDLESFDVSTEFECILTGENPTTFSSTIGLNELDFQNHIPVDVISPFKSKRNAYDIVKGVAVPYLTLERATYRFGLRQNATQQFSLKGDSIYYIPGQPRYMEIAYNTGNSGLNSYTFSPGSGDAILFDEGTFNTYALCITAVSDDGTYRRLFAGDDYSSTAAGWQILQPGADKVNAMTGTKTLRVVYGTTSVGSYQTTNPQGQPVHVTDLVKPAAVRPKDIDVYIGSTDATPVWTRFNSVQSVEANWSVALENDEEFGNKHYVASDYDVPEVTGTIGVKAFDVVDLFDKISQITGVVNTEVIGPSLTTPVPMEIHIRNPNTGTRMKTIYVPDARFQVPGLQGRVQTKLENSFAFSSDSGVMKVYNGKRINNGND